MPYPQKQVSDPATARRRLILYKLALPHSLPCHRPFLPFIFRRLASALRSATRLSHHDDHKNCQPKFLHAFSPIAIHTIFQSGSVIQLSPEIVNALNPLPLSPNLNPNHSPYPKLYTPPQKKKNPRRSRSLLSINVHPSSKSLLLLPQPGRIAPAILPGKT